MHPASSTSTSRPTPGFAATRRSGRPAPRDSPSVTSIATAIWTSWSATAAAGSITCICTTGRCSWRTRRYDRRPPGERDSRDAVCADFDADGDLDVAIAIGGDAQDAIYENLGVARFEPSPSTRLPRASSTVDLDAADIDADGDVDLLAAVGTASATGEAPRTSLWLNRGETPIGFDEHLRRFGDDDGGATQVVFADFDADGDVDFARLSVDVENRLFLNSLSGTLGRSPLPDGLPGVGGHEPGSACDLGHSSRGPRRRRRPRPGRGERRRSRPLVGRRSRVVHALAVPLPRGGAHRRPGRPRSRRTARVRGRHRLDQPVVGCRRLDVHGLRHRRR